MAKLLLLCYALLAAGVLLPIDVVRQAVRMREGWQPSHPGDVIPTAYSSRCPSGPIEQWRDIPSLVDVTSF